MSETILEIENLSVVYETDMETVHAVNGISFSLGKGRLWGWWERRGPERRRRR